MDRSNYTNISQGIRRMGRVAGLLAVVLTGLAGRAGAQSGPLPASPKVPTGYQSPLFHSGGALDPNTAAVPPVFLPGVFQGQLQGTATGVNGTVETQIPSYLLGAYDPTTPPGNTANASGYYPEHFADGDIYSWQAPFDYVAQSNGFDSVDDTAPSFVPGTLPAADGFNFTAAWQLVDLTGPNASPAAATATNSEYLRLPPSTDGTATWQLVEKNAGSYSVYFNIPNDLPDATGKAELRSTSVIYFLTVRDANGTVTASGTATASQTEANTNQFLAGPFEFVAGGSVTVTLKRDTPNNINSGNYNLVADSMVLQTAIGDVQSTPTAINYESYPTDFLRAQYWGIAANAPGGANAAQNAPPDLLGTTAVLRYGDPTKASDALHRIRQLVYFGRSEPVFSQSVSVDNSDAANFTATGGQSVTDPTASNGQYLKIPASTTPSPNASAVWTIQAPTFSGPTPHFYVTVHLPKSNELRLTQVTYTVFDVTRNIQIGRTAVINQMTNGTDVIVTLPTGPLKINPGDIIKVNLFNFSGQNTSFVVADSVSLTTGNGQGAIYCVDGFTGGVVWRYETSSALTASTPVYSSPVVTKINVLTTPAGPGGVPAAVYQNKLVVIVGDNNGLVYCLDAIGNADGTSNANVLDANGLPIYEAQPPYGTAAPAFAQNTPHVGTTAVYWVYRPDATKPKYVTGPNRGAIKPVDVSSDLPVPGAFNTASPTVFVDPNANTLPANNVPPLPGGLPPSNATIYVGNTNGVLYALDATGTTIDGTSQASFNGTGDTFNASLDLRTDPTIFPAVPADPVVPTCQPKWWFTLRGPDPNSGNTASNADIESAPALYIATKANAAQPTGFDYTPTVFIGSAHEQEATSNVGRLYALNGLYGPSGSNGASDPSPAGQPDPTKPGYTGPGSVNYNVAQRPQINTADVTDWSFPDAYGIGKSSDKKPRPALGNVTGSPVVFTDPHETTAARQTRVYFAACSGLEVPNGSASGTLPSARPDDTQTGRVWAVNLDGSVGTTTNSGANGTVWSYPLANDPNDKTKDNVAEPNPPIGAFLHGTPAIGFVQFPQSIVNGNGSVYAPKDVINTGANGVKGQSVPMLYLATRGVSDTALYALDIDGNITTGNPGTDQRLIYRQPSPDGSIFQSSPALVTNASSSGGNGGAVFVTAGSTFYDISATPITPTSSTVFAGEAFPLIRVNREFTGFGPFSSPTVSATDVSDLNGTTPYLKPGGGFYNVTDWVYVGDSSTGFCRGITPNDKFDLGIPPDLGQIVPPSVDSPGTVDLSAALQAYLVDETNNQKTGYGAHLAFGAGTPLPVYEWGQSVYIRFANVVLPGVDPTKFVYDQSAAAPKPSAANPVAAYSNGGPIEFDISDATQGIGGAALNPPDHAVIPAVVVTVPAGNAPLPDGFIQQNPAAPLSDVINLAGPNNTEYIGAYTYTIADGSARRNTPGSRRQILNARQRVEVGTTDGVTFTASTTPKFVELTAFISNGNEVSTPTGGTPPYALKPVPPRDQPTFGILNPLGLRGGGLNLLGNGAQAYQIGDTVGPFRGISSSTGTIPNSAPAAFTAAWYDLQALANGNDIPLYAPPSSAGGGGIIDPTAPLNSAKNAPFNPPTQTNVTVTSTPLIGHGKSGDNVDPSGLPEQQGSTALPSVFPNGLAKPYNDFGSYALNVFDRGAIGLLAQQLRVKAGTVSGGGDGLYWNDNTIGPFSAPFGTGHDAVVNYLPWELAPPVAGYKAGVANSSPDYPDISPSNVTALLHQYGGGGGQDMTEGQAYTKPATPNGTLQQRFVYANPIQIHVTIPRFQPANQQLYQEFPNGHKYDAGGEIPPVDASANKINSNNNVFPMGYVTTRRIYVPNQNGFYLPGAAFRDVRVYTGVPPDFGVQMSTPTADIGKVPSGFGIQTSQFAPLIDTNGVRTFDPYNLLFQDYYQPLDISNTGNVNWLNAHLDQKRLFNGNSYSLPLYSDSLDPLSFIPGYDANGATGPRLNTFNTNKVPEEPFLVRSSLDGDMVTAFGHNPNVPPNVYPGATFHKARVGDASPSTLTVPDAPEAFVPGATLDVPADGKPTHALDGKNGNLPFKTAPFVSVAIPFGMPVGSYSGTLQLFEGLDTGGYKTYNNTGGPYIGLIAQLYPPQYGKAIGGIGTPTVDGFGRLLDNNNQLADTVQIIQPAGAPSAITLMPTSINGTAVKVKVVEDRMTDGATFGGVSQVDQGPALPPNPPTPARTVPNFAPAAYRDPASGSLSVYWTSGRDSTTPPATGFNIFQALVPTLNGAYMPVNPAGPGTFAAPNYVNQWWTSLADAANGYNADGTLKPVLASSQGTNSGLSITNQDPLNPGAIFAFGVNVQATATIPYQNTLLCYPVTPATGALGTAQQVTNDPGQVKYGVKGLTCKSAGFTRNLWAFWTATTRGRTAVYYNSQDPTTGAWVPATGSKTLSSTGLLPIPAGLTAVSDPVPMLLYSPVTVSGSPLPQLQATIAVTYSGTAPDGNVDLYESHYQPDLTKPYQLALVAYQPVTEILNPTGKPGDWSQARDVAWSRTNPLNLYVKYLKGSGPNPPSVTAPILYDPALKPLFGRAVFDKASGLLVLTNVAIPDETPDAAGATLHTVYVDYATGRVRFSPALRTPNVAPASQAYEVRALFSPLARRITTDPRADTGASTFLDGALKINEAPGSPPITPDRRWYVWRKSGTGGAAPSATIYYKTQRLTCYLPSAIGYSIVTPPAAPALLLTSVKINGTDVTNLVDVDYTRGRIYFPINANGTVSEGQGATVTYAPANTVTPGNPNGTTTTVITDTIQWQDEEHALGEIPPLDTASGLNSVYDVALAIDTAVNENNVTAFLDPDAYNNKVSPPDLSHPHKIWLFWNSTRNGTADVYYETIDPRFAAGP